MENCFQRNCRLTEVKLAVADAVFAVCRFAVVVVVVVVIVVVVQSWSLS